MRPPLGGVRGLRVGWRPTGPRLTTLQRMENWIEVQREAYPLFLFHISSGAGGRGAF